MTTIEALSKYLVALARELGEAVRDESSIVGYIEARIKAAEALMASAMEKQYLINKGKLNDNKCTGT